MGTQLQNITVKMTFCSFYLTKSRLARFFGLSGGWPKWKSDVLLFMESGKWYGIAPLLGSGGIRPGANDPVDCTTHGGGTGGKLPGDHALKCGHQGGPISATIVG